MQQQPRVQTRNSLSTVDSSSVGPKATKSTSVAPTALEPSLLRGVRASTVLRCCCSCFGSQEALESNYQQSFETTRIADFLSHDWVSGRWGKLLGLCLVYNSLAALVASLVAAYALALMQYGDEPLLPGLVPPLDGGTVRQSKYSYWCQVCCPMIFIMFFLFWQDMRSFMQWSTRTCFVDKFCIDQTNADRKAAGIFGLAGFLRCSDWFVVLWTPRYFTRLWCTYEVASWLYLQKPLGSVLLMPLEHAKTIVTLMLGCCCGFFAASVCVMFFPTLQPLAISLGCFVPVTIGAHQARRSARHLRTLTLQLAQFSVTSSDCHCCTVHHKRTTGEKIPCDREVVYATIADWFGEDDGDDAAISRFDMAVRKQFAPKVLAKAGPTQLSYRYTVMVGWPFLFRGCDVLADSGQYTEDRLWNTIIMYPTLALVAVPAWYKIAMYLAYSLDSWVGIPASRVTDYSWTLALGTAYSVLLVLTWYPLEVLVLLSANSWLMILAAIGLATAAGGLFQQDLRELVERVPLLRKFMHPRHRPREARPLDEAPRDLREVAQRVAKHSTECVKTKSSVSSSDESEADNVDHAESRRPRRIASLISI